MGEVEARSPPRQTQEAPGEAGGLEGAGGGRVVVMAAAVLTF